MKNTIAAYKYELSYDDKKREKKVTVQRSKTVTWVRPRGLHLSQGGVIKNEIMSASLFDLALIWYQIDPASLPHNFSVYIPKSESAEEAFWWRDLFQAFAKSERPAEGLHQVHGAGGGAPAGLPDGRISFQSCASTAWD